jgi:hypothetical protein
VSPHTDRLVREAEAFATVMRKAMRRRGEDPESADGMYTIRHDTWRRYHLRRYRPLLTIRCSHRHLLATVFPTPRGPVVGGTITLVRRIREDHTIGRRRLLATWLDDSHWPLNQLLIDLDIGWTIPRVAERRVWTADMIRAMVEGPAIYVSCQCAGVRAIPQKLVRDALHARTRELLIP